MTVAMAEQRSLVPARRPARDVSPELALVDPFLAAEERTRLAVPPVVSPRASAMPGLAVREPEPLDWLSRMPAYAREAQRRLRRPRHMVPIVAASTVLCLLLIDSRAQVDDPLVVSESPIVTSQVPRSLDGPRPRRFAWAPVAGAERYAFELFKGANLVYKAQSAGAQLAVPARWRSGGQLRSLVPGQYRWYVWPVSSGRRAATAVVQAQLTIS